MKKILCALFLAGMLVALTGCNKQLIDLNFKYDSAIIRLPDGSVVSGPVESWTDYEDGDQLQIKINGVTYLVHSMNVVLISGEASTK